MLIKTTLCESDNECFLWKLEKWKKVKKIISEMVYKLFNQNNDITIVYWNHENWKENYQIFEQLIWIEKLWEKNISVKQIATKYLDEYNIVEAVLLEIKLKGWKKIYKNVTSVSELSNNKSEKKLKHIHISEPRMLNNEKVVELGKKFKQNFINIEDYKQNINWIKDDKLLEKLNWDKSIENIAKTIMTEFWGKALLENPENVVKLFWEKALLKWTVVQHFSLGKEYWVLDYFKHFCKRKPIMQLKNIDTKYLKGNKSILATWEYLFKLKNPDQDVFANFTMIFVHKEWKWIIDVLHSSIKYSKTELQKLNKE